VFVVVGVRSRPGRRRTWIIVRILSTGALWLIDRTSCGRLDITYVRTVSGFASTAFVTDVHCRTIVGLV